MYNRGACVRPFLQWKSKSIIYSESAFVDLGIEHTSTMPMRHIAIYNIVPHSLINGTIFEKELRTYNVCFDFL
jgi:hypothetical protein